MFFSQTVPAVRYAAIALAMIHRKYLDHDSSVGVHRSQSLKDWSPDKAPLRHYNHAIQLLLNQEGGDNTEITAITLLVCYLFICFDYLAGNYVQAVKHLRGGVGLSRNIDKAILNNSSTYDDARLSGIGTLICQITRQICRLDMQAVTFLVDWTPAGIQETFTSQLPSSGNTFWSLDQAADHLQILVARVMRLRNTEQQMCPMGEMPPSSLSLKNIILAQLETWLSFFETMLQQGSSYENDLETHRLASLLRLQHTIAWTLVSSYGPGREMAYDDYLPKFQQCLVLAGDIVAHEQCSEWLQPTFTPEVGIVPVLYIIGVKCRHPIVRRQVLNILRRQTIREAVWNSIFAARVVERVIEIEEGELEEAGLTQGMERIPVWQRIETLSWVHVVSGQSAPRLDITYTFCMREGTYTESLRV
ncbi:hypothetical protein PISL3812_00606 [Talaromyces islandicus]|uniref:Uncharacterized protein n=1 Tax=Talaromyces islandicus TaxID=28573 RepID=A0A0U1LJW8_TALIS|nr:hypothetical protein PISL3812_00606 [Talaromyces islandicus]